jgi:hypothetical protein
MSQSKKYDTIKHTPTGKKYDHSAAQAALRKAERTGFGSKHPRTARKKMM